MPFYSDVLASKSMLVARLSPPPIGQCPFPQELGAPADLDRTAASQGMQFQACSPSQETATDLRNLSWSYPTRRLEAEKDSPDGDNRLPHCARKRHGHS